MVEDFVDSIMDKKRIKDQLGKADTVILAVSKWNTERLNLYSMRIRVSSKKYNNSFVLDHATRGELNVDRLGDNSEVWKVIRETGGVEKITDAGKELIVKWIKGDTVLHFNYIGYGTDSTDFNINQTTLGTETKRNQTFQGQI